MLILSAQVAITPLGNFTLGDRQRGQRLHHPSNDDDPEKRMIGTSRFMFLSSLASSKPICPSNMWSAIVQQTRVSRKFESDCPEIDVN